MSLKHFILYILFIPFVLSAQAQDRRSDKIFKKNGEVIPARLIIVNSDAVVFKRSDNADGPEYTVSKADVAKIRYSNGTEDVFEENTVGMPAENHRRMSGDYSCNSTIIAFAPIQFTEHGYGFSLSYERTIDRSGWVSFYVPGIVTFNFIEDSYNYGGSAQQPMFYIMPGIKVYTNLNNASRSKFSIGPSLVIGAGSEKAYYQNAYNPYATQSRFLLGAMVNLTGNFFATPRLYLGAEWGLGITYLNQYDGVNRPVEFLTQIGFKIGYRYTSKSKG
jgi:hypothetical protein